MIFIVPLRWGSVMRRLLAIFVVLITSGCATTPHFDQISGVTPKTIVDVIECEIIAARKKYRVQSDRQWARFWAGRQTAKYPIRDLRGFHAVAELNLQVDEQLTLAPSFTHTDVVSKSLTRIFDWGVKFDTQSQRVYSESVVFDIGRMADDKPSCRDRLPGVSLNGTLGIEEVVDMAFGSIDPDDQAIGFPEAENGGGRLTPFTPKSGKGGKSGAKKGGASKSGSKGSAKGAFGTSLEFSIVAAITPTGPTWSLVSFKGPGKLFSTQRVDTHKVTISFAPTAEGAVLQNFLMTNSALPTMIKRLERQ
jgi:hypothetical protein